ncbi:MAG: TfpX/TfpZ family type IV pilin accessory protein [Usitatibacter sp.]
MKTRLRASGIHFGLSATVAALVFAVIALVWYPGGFLSGAGGLELFLLVASVDVTLGPLLTFIVFVPGKKGLAFDLAVIGTLQVAALVYGVHVLFEARPAYVVFVKDRFEVVRANEIEDADLAKGNPGFDAIPITGPRIAAARLPTDPAEATRIMLSGIAGKDIQTFPQHYVPYDEMRGTALAQAKPLRDLRALNPSGGTQIDAVLKDLSIRDEGARFLPVRAGKRDLVALLDAREGRVLKFVALRPWEY